MAKIKLNFQFKGKFFCLCATVIGTTIRHYKEASLINPNFKAWDKKKQMFVEATGEAMHNNKVLLEMKTYYQSLIDKFDPSTGTELWELGNTGTETKAKTKKETLTFGDYVKSLINQMQNENRKKPSKNFQHYITLLHKLEKEGNIINVPLSEIENKHFIAFSDWIKSLSSDDKTNYMNNMKPP